MKHQPSTPAPSLRVMSTDNLGHQDGVNKSSAASNTIDAPRLYFNRTALFSALTTSLVGFGCSIVPAAFAATDDLNNNANNSQIMAKTATVAPIKTSNLLIADDDSQTDMALDALRLKKAVEQGIIDQSVLDDYSEQTLGIKKPNSGSKNSNNNEQLNTADTNADIEQQAAAIQQQGYQMMTPDEIDRELAAMDRQNAQDIDNISSNNFGSAKNSGFNAPIATLDALAPPIGLDIELDASSLPTPSNLDTLGISETAADQAETAEIMSRPIEVSDAVSSGSATQAMDNDILANMNQGKNTAGSINPNDYLPDYQNDTEAVSESIEQAKTPSPMARNKGNIVKRLYDRLFNAGSLALPHVDTTIYLQQAAANTNAVTSKPVLVKADNDVQPIKNIKAALDETTVQSVIDFTAALPRLRQTALDAAKAVGYYDITLRLRQPYTDTIDVVIEKLGEPVRVDSRIVDIRGEGSEQKEFAALEKDLPPKEGDIFNHRVYKDSKAALESLSNTYGYFDQYWLNKSVDIILPDNTADVSLVYNTGDRYEFDEVVFFTYDEESGTLTRDPEKLPVELSLLRQLFNFKEGDPFYRPAVTKFSNDLSATRYFNTINVESILPPDERTQSATLAFDNTLNTNGDSVDVLDGDINNASDVSNARQIDGLSKDGAIYSTSGEKVNPADIAAIEFEADEETLEKLQAIKQKAERLSRLPNDRVLDEKDQDSNSLLGKVSDAISDVVQKIFPDEKNILADENFVPPTLAGRKTPEEVLESKKVPLYVFVSANKPRDAQVGLGYGTDTGVRVTAKIDYNLLNRKGYQAGFETEVSRITKNASVYASRPWKHPLNDKLDARLTYEEEVINQGEGNFDLSTKTVKAALTRNIRRENGWNRSYSLRYRLDELETGIDDTQLDDLPIRFTSSTPRQQALLLGYGISKTDVDSATNPTRGIRQYYSIEAGADKALSETNLAIARAGVSGIYSFGSDDKHQVLGSINTGYIWADDFYEVPYKLRFFAGGDQSIRGYDYESLSPIDKGYLTGGQILAVGSAEYNYEFKPGFRGAVFTDIGNAYDKDFETDTKVGVGVGIRWASPVGVVRVDVAAGVTEENIPVRLHLFIGSPL